jgi:hypothetical protein
MSVRTVGAIDATAFVAVERLATLEEVLAWCHGHTGDVVEVVVQDELTHDVIVRAAAPAFLVFDTT